MKNNIRAQENSLFEDWMKTYQQQTFVVDGCINPEKYTLEETKVVFLLKDENTGENFQDPIRPLRDEIAVGQHHWWQKVAFWGYFILNPNSSVKEAEQRIFCEPNWSEILHSFCIVNIKKASGVGSVSAKVLESFVRRDGLKLKDQLNIYNPDVLVACGNGDQVISLFDESELFTLDSGICYWKVRLAGKDCHVIDYCHPASRAGNTVKGVIAQALAKAIHQICSEIEC